MTNETESFETAVIRCKIVDIYLGRVSVAALTENICLLVLQIEQYLCLSENLHLQRFRLFNQVISCVRFRKKKWEATQKIIVSTRKTIKVFY